MTTMTGHPLKRILGLGFGLALVFGTMVGVGILRLPGTVAAALGDRTLIMLTWTVGALFALMGAVSVAELAAMMPEAGGFRIYARRAFGEGVGFAVGWLDWLVGVATIAFAAVTAVAFLGALWLPAIVFPRALAVALLAIFTALHWMGLRVGGSLTATISVAIGLMLMILVVGCFIATPIAGSTVAPLATTAASLVALGCTRHLFREPACQPVD
jgi:basic amino acid/polyamine antiporter, APA family